MSEPTLDRGDQCVEWGALLQSWWCQLWLPHRRALKGCTGNHLAWAVVLIAVIATWTTWLSYFSPVILHVITYMYVGKERFQIKRLSKNPSPKKQLNWGTALWSLVFLAKKLWWNLSVPVSSTKRICLKLYEAPAVQAKDHSQACGDKLKLVQWLMCACFSFLALKLHHSTLMTSTGSVYEWTKWSHL